MTLGSSSKYLLLHILIIIALTWISSSQAVHLDPLQQRFVRANGIDIHIAEQGSGPVVILLHGFPEIWYTWRNQFEAIAQQGFHVVAPDFRGFGGTVNPYGPEKLYWEDLLGDVVGLIQSFGQEKVFVVGHDLGGVVGWYLCAFRPDLVQGYVSLGIPYIKPQDPETTNRTGLAPPPYEGFYASRFMQPGRADADFARFNISTVWTNIYKLFSSSELRVASATQEIMDLIQPSEQLPSYLTQADVDVYVENYNTSGFSQPIRASYVNFARNFELLSPWANFLIRTPCLYVVGENDYVNKFPGVTFNLVELRKDAPGLDSVVNVTGGHFMQEEVPTQVNHEILKFIKKL